MKRLPYIFLFFLFLVCSWSVFAAQIVGSVRDGGRPVAANTEIRVTCGSNQPHVTRTDQYGSYSVYVGETGKCTFTITYNGRALSADVYSYADPVHADFDVAKDQNGNPVLRRR
jgi:hypothetical protein